MQSMNRRDFLHNSALFAGVAGVGLGGDLLAAKEKAKKKQAPSDTLRVAVIGVRGRGNSHVSGLANRNGCIVTTICDADSAVIGKAMKAVEKRQGKAPKFEQDIRKVVEDQNIDIISIATPNHWHALASIWAIQNGKDVYVEKPVSHNVSEGRRIVEAARKHGRICQTGTQIRSMPGIRQAIKFIHDGKLGKVKVARALCYKRRKSIGDVTKPQPIPKSIDYDLWCGPAPKKPLMRQKLHYDWHWIWDYGNGDLGNQGIHQMDVARWALGKQQLSNKVISVGGRFGYKDDGETANTQICVFDYGDSQLIFEVRGLETQKYKGAGVGNIIHCEEGYVVFPSYGSATAYTNGGEKIKSFGGGSDHFSNFVKAVRSRKVSDLNADIEDGHLSSALCHLGNISYRLGDEVGFGQRSALKGNEAAGETFERMVKHLKDNKISLEETKYRMGQSLTLNPKEETFVDNSEANTMLTREYRKGFEVPAKI